MMRPVLMHFEGPPYEDGRGPKITVEYSERVIGRDNEPGVRIKTFGDEDVVVFATEIDWLIRTLQRIQQEPNP